LQLKQRSEKFDDNNNNNNNDDNNNNNNNVIKKEAEKILKYKDVIIEIQRMWNVKAKVMAVIIGVIGTMSKSLTQSLSNIQRKHEIKEPQKSEIFCSAHMLREVLL